MNYSYVDYYNIDDTSIDDKGRNYLAKINWKGMTDLFLSIKILI